MRDYKMDDIRKPLFNKTIVSVDYDREDYYERKKLPFFNELILRFDDGSRLVIIPTSDDYQNFIDWWVE